MPGLAIDPAVSAKLTRLRSAYPVFRIESAGITAQEGTVRLSFRFTCGDKTFEPSAEITGLTQAEAGRAGDPAARNIVRALAIVEAASYWKAFCSPVIEVGTGGADPAERAWWDAFWQPAMGEFYFRNGIDFTAPGFLRFRSASATGAMPASVIPAEGASRPLVMFSGGKDSLALTYALKDGPTDFFLYNPVPAQRGLAESLADGGRITEVRRAILPGLLAMNDSGEYLNGHTPYSAYLALAAMLVGYLRGNGIVAAGNSRSDDEPNVEEYRGQTVNHQWTKSASFETALQEYAARWLPGAPGYCSPLRPLYELQIIKSLEPHMDMFFASQSCNKTKSQGWCRKCAKCSWVFLATAALFGRDTAVSKLGGDLFADPELAALFGAMAGITGEPKPFECTGTELEVRAAIAAAGRQAGSAAALKECLRNPAVLGTRPLETVLKDWGQDNLMPDPLRVRAQRAVPPGFLPVS